MKLLHEGQAEAVGPKTERNLVISASKVAEIAGTTDATFPPDKGQHSGSAGI